MYDVFNGFYADTADENAVVSISEGNDGLEDGESLAVLSDTIYNSVDNTVVYGTSGDDSILSTGLDVTINAGGGNDYVDPAGLFNVVVYNEGDGNDTIEGFGITDTLNVTSGNYTTIKSNDGVIVQVGDGSIYIDTLTETTPVNIIGNYSNSSSSNSTGILQPVNNTYTYSGGNATITSYAAGEKINFATYFAGIDWDDDNFMIKSSSGTLTIQNFRDKFINVADANGNPAAYAYMSTNAGTLDGSSYDKLEVIFGADFAENNIIAGNAGSILWGGFFSNDTLVGGNGEDIFFASKYGGSDIIKNASSEDKVDLLSLNLSDIVSANVSGGVISANFNTGYTLQINCTENLSPTFQLADSSWQYNHSNNAWIQK